MNPHEDTVAALQQTESELCEALGEHDLEVAVVRTELGAALQRAGRLVEAHQAYGAALAARELALGPYHPELGPTLLDLGQLAAERGDRVAASSYARRAQAVLEGHVASDDPLLVLARTWVVRQE